MRPVGAGVEVQPAALFDVGGTWIALEAFDGDRAAEQTLEHGRGAVGVEQCLVQRRDRDGSGFGDVIHPHSSTRRGARPLVRATIAFCRKSRASTFKRRRVAGDKQVGFLPGACAAGCGELGGTAEAVAEFGHAVFVDADGQAPAAWVPGGDERRAARVHAGEQPVEVTRQAADPQVDAGDAVDAGAVGAGQMQGQICGRHEA